jgi:hypothetical protein
MTPVVAIRQLAINTLCDVILNEVKDLSSAV